MEPEAKSAKIVSTDAHNELLPYDDTSGGEETKKESSRFANEQRERGFRELSDGKIQQKLDEYLRKNSGNHTVCRAMRELAMQHLGFVNMRHIASGEADAENEWQRVEGAPRVELGEDMVKDELKKAFLADNPYLGSYSNSVSESILQLYDAFLEIIGGDRFSNTDHGHRLGTSNETGGGMDFEQKSAFAAVDGFPDLRLPEGFLVTNAFGRGDCFFHACAQGLSSIFYENYTTYGLRRLCADYMERLRKKCGWNGNWIYDIYKKRISGSDASLRREAVTSIAKDVYIKKQTEVAWSVEDIEALGLDSDAAWAEQEVDGRIICIEINENLQRNGSSVKIRIHTIEVHTVDGENIFTHHLMDEEGEIEVEENSVDALYQDKSTVHVICNNSHWRPILPPNASFETRKEINSTQHRNDRGVKWDELLASVSDFVSEKEISELREAIKLLQAPIRTVSQLLISKSTLSKQQMVFEQLFAKYKKYSTSSAVISANAVKQSMGEEMEEMIKMSQVVRISLNMEFDSQIEGFIDFLLENKANEIKLKDIFFANVPLVARDISKRVRDLSFYLHPDKYKKLDESNRHDLVSDLFNKLHSISNDLRRVIEEHASAFDEGIVKYHKDEAFQFWELALDFQNASKNNATLNRLSREALDELTARECEDRRMIFALSSYKEYRAAVRLIDKEVERYKSLKIDVPISLMNEQIQLRNYAALALYLAGSPDSKLYAQIYVLGALRLLLKHPSSDEKAYKESFNILEKIKGNVVGAEQRQTQGVAPSNESTATISSTELVASNLGVLSLPQEPPRSHQERANFIATVNQDIAELILRADRTLITPDSSLIDSTIYRAGIERTEIQSVRHITGGLALLAGGGVAAAGGAVVAVAADTAAISLSLAVSHTVAMATLVGGLVGIGLCAMALIYFGMGMWSKGKQMAYEPGIRKRLNHMIETAVKAYIIDGNLGEFLKILGRKHEGEDGIINFCPDKSRGGGILDVNAKEVVERLLNHGFTADGVACLLNMIGNAMMSSEVNVADVTRVEFRAASIKFFHEVIESVKLSDGAKQSDADINEAVNLKWLGINLAGTWGNWKDIPSKYFEYLKASSSPFQDKLMQMRNVAMVNLAVVNIILAGADNMSAAASKMKNIRELMHRGLDPNKASHAGVDEELKIRLSVLEDFFVALGASGYEEEADIVLAPSMAATLKKVNHREGSYLCESHVILNKHLDALLILNQLSNGLVFIDRQTFLIRLSEAKVETEFNVIATELLNLLESQSQITAQVLACKYLPLLSKITELEFVVCKQNLERNAYDPLKSIIAVDRPVARIYLAVANQDDEEPVVAFVAIDNLRLNELFEQLKKLKKEDKDKIINTHRELAYYYRSQAVDIEKVSHIRSLHFWMKSSCEFDSILDAKLNPYDMDASLGYAECQLHLGKYTRALNFLKQRYVHLHHNPKYSLLRAKLSRKQGDYDLASMSNSKVGFGTVLPDDVSIENKREKKIVKGLRSVTRYEFVEKLRKNNLGTGEQLLRTRGEEDNVYGILSIDGGGIRGILPAVWLAELERRAHRPISQLFKLIAGTSTGGVIGAGLSLPNAETLTPKYRAYELLDLYATKANEIFTPLSLMRRVRNAIPVVGSMFGEEKYDNSGRQRLFGSYFGDARLKDSLTELLIPAFDEHNRQQAFLFTRREARAYSFKNYKFSEAVMATSTAPTYFPVYQAGGSSFLDGAIIANNPSELAFKEAESKHEVDRSNIILLSLGTGDCVADPLNAGASRSGLFWARNIHKAFLDPQPGDADDYLHNRLKDRYYRWQSWFEEPIEMDDYSPETINRLLDLARECIEELDASDRDPINQVVERLGGPVLRTFNV